MIGQLRNSVGNITNDHEEMKTIAVTHFQNAFSTQEHFIDNSLLDCIPRMINAEENESLCAVPSEAEIKEVVFNMSVDSAPGPDGFSGVFF